VSTGSPSQDAQHDFSRARRARLLADIARRLRGEPDDVAMILPFEEVVEALGRAGERPLGLQEIAVYSIVGTVDRTRDFDRDFRPTTARLRERWERIAAAQELASAALERVLERGLAGRTERAVALELEQEMRPAFGIHPEQRSFDRVQRNKAQIPKRWRATGAKCRIAQPDVVDHAASMSGSGAASSSSGASTSPVSGCTSAVT